MEKVEVLKFGGSALGKSGSKLEEILPILQQKWDKGIKTIIIVSAFEGVTRNLQNKSILAGNAVSSIEEDKFLSQGESDASYLVFNKLLNLGVEARYLSVRNVPIITDRTFGNAKVLFVDKDLIKANLSGSALVIPGFVGRTVYGETTTLGFDGSDTTAAWVAAILKCPCNLYKDVNGIYTANPKEVPKAKHLPALHVLDALTLAMLGSSVVHERALLIAKSAKIDIRVYPSFELDSSKYTVISKDFERDDVAGIAYCKTQEGIVISAVGKKVFNGVIYDYLSKTYSLERFFPAIPNVDSVLLKNEQDLKIILAEIHKFYKLDK